MAPPPVALRLVGVVCVIVTLAWNESALALEPGGLSGPPGPPVLSRGSRAEMDGFAAALDAAVRRVSRPSPAMLAGREIPRAYRLPGFGALFVLPPRALPAPPPRPAAELSAARAVDAAIRHLEQGLRTASSPELREQMERNLQALKQTRTELQTPYRERAATIMVLKSPPPAVVMGPADASELRLEQLRRALETQMAEHLRALQTAERTDGEQEREMARRMEGQVLELQARMESVRREVEEARMEAERQVEMRLAFPPAPADVPEAPAAAAAPVTPGARPEVTTPPAPAPPALPLAPWQYWFNADEPADGRTEEALVRDVKAAVTALVERRGATLRQLAPEEYVTVAVDFVPRMSILGSRIQKTLVVKVKKQDLDDRRAGRLTADELRQRIEYAEY
jgi:hypothetical protein